MEKTTLSVDSNFMSPYALAAYVALIEKEIPFEVVRVDLGARQQHDPGFRDRSLTARVPLLEHRGFALTESSAITEYLDEVFPAPLQPAPTPPEEVPADPLGPPVAQDVTPSPVARAAGPAR